MAWCLLMPRLVWAQHILARPFPFYYQLYSNEVFDIYQDRMGYLWFGMTSGLARYDGHNLHTFRSDYQHPNLLTDNRIVYITDNSRYVWISTGAGVSLYDKLTWKTSKVMDKRIDGQSITDIKANPMTDEVWVGKGNHVFRCSPDGKLLKEYLLQEGIPDEGIKQLYVDRQCQVWVCSANGLFRYDKTKDQFMKLPLMPDGASPFTMLQDRQGRYWIGTWGQGLWLFNPKAAECYQRQKVNVSGSDEEDMVFFSMAQDDVYGYLWLLSYQELHALKFQDGKLVPVDISHIIDPHKMFTKILKDREGNLWIGSFDMGYTIYFNRTGVVGCPMSSLRELLHHDANIVTLGYEGHNVLWMGQDRYGLLLYNCKTGQVSLQAKLNLGEIYSIKRARKYGMWLRLRNKNRIVKAVFTSQGVNLVEDIDMYKLLANPGEILDINEDAKGNLWILTTTNLYVHTPKSSTLFIAGKDVLRPDAFAMDTKGHIWTVKGKNVYLMSFNSPNISAKLVGMVNLLSRGEVVNHLCVDKKGVLWLTTSLSRIIKSNEGKTKYAMLHTTEVADGGILSVLADGNKVWVLTNKKLVCIDIFTLKEMVYEANSDHVGVKAFLKSALCPDMQGGVFVGGNDGVAQITANAFKMSLPKNFKLRVSDIWVNGVSVMFDTVDKDSREGIVYLPSDSRNIRISIASLLFSPTVIEKIQYKLDGVDLNWNDLDCKTWIAYYSSLPRGKHCLKVRWQKENGTWTASQDILVLVRKPAFYESTIAFVIYTLLLLAMIYYIIYAIRRRASLSALRHYHNQTRLGKMIEERSKEQIHLSGAPDNAQVNDLSKSEDGLSDADRVFFKHMMDFIEQNLSNAEYGQEQLAQDLLLSRSTLYRKIKAMTGMSPLDFMKNVKMKKACELLNRHQMSVSEIAYALGFTSPKYFTKCFKEELGQTPTEYQKQNAE